MKALSQLTHLMWGIIAANMLALCILSGRGPDLSPCMWFIFGCMSGVSVCLVALELFRSAFK